MIPLLFCEDRHLSLRCHKYMPCIFAKTGICLLCIIYKKADDVMKLSQNAKNAIKSQKMQYK